MTGHTSWRQLQADKHELGPRVARALHSEAKASQSRNAAELMSLLLAKRIRARTLREGVTNRDARNVPAVQVPERPRGPVGPARFQPFAGNGCL